MSHFTVLVVAENEDDLHEKLLPFHERESTGYDDYCTWVDDIHDKNLEKYRTEKIECIIQNGKILGTKYSNDPIIKSMYVREKKDGDIFSTEYFKLKDGYDIVEECFNNIYSTFDEYMTDWCGYTEKNPKTGKFERWTNPNSKWDWYAVGGRWEGLLSLKNGGNSSWAVVSDVDFDRMYTKEQDKLEKEWKLFHQLYNECDKEWSNIEEDGYLRWSNRNPRVKELLTSDSYLRAKYAFDKMDWIMWSLDDVMSFFKKNIEEYSSPGGLTYAFIDNNGNWNQKGEMGWFGIDDPDKATNCYDGEWWKFVQSLRLDNNIYIVDCHI
jgi:hypothetical protein